MDAFAVCALFEGRYRYVFKFANDMDNWRNT